MKCLATEDLLNCTFSATVWSVFLIIRKTFILCLVEQVSKTFDLYGFVKIKNKSGRKIHLHVRAGHCGWPDYRWFLLSFYIFLYVTNFQQDTTDLFHMKNVLRTHRTKKVQKGRQKRDTASPPEASWKRSELWLPQAVTPTLGSCPILTSPALTTQRYCSHDAGWPIRPQPAAESGAVFSLLTFARRALSGALGTQSPISTSCINTWRGLTSSSELMHPEGRAAILYNNMPVLGMQ